jgi:hypothetical protein
MDDHTKLRNRQGLVKPYVFSSPADDYWESISSSQIVEDTINSLQERLGRNVNSKRPKLIKMLDAQA